ncbi:hypothetical protein [Lamprocystis purpurea]|jgi:hypothetical protein|uniref:hypothetical protein n=1 Tax=Lamprocystis purpurea TaxID=61598 RepID=UPI0003738EBA|nr:hypothetical protein [Lamprocystis purpurea]
MITLQTSAGIRTSAEIRGFRSLRHPVGPRLSALDTGRMMQGRAHRMARMDHKSWFVGLGR